MTSALGTKIRKLRKEKGFTLDQLAELTSSSKSYIWELENRPSPPRPSAEKLERIAEKLGTTIEFLLDVGDSISSEEAEDARFYRNYRSLDKPVKDKIRSMMKLLNDEF